MSRSAAPLDSCPHPNRAGCGTNTECYAAISAAVSFSDPHMLSAYPFSGFEGSAREVDTNSTKKVPSSSDSFLYTLSTCFRYFGDNKCYVVVTRDPALCSMALKRLTSAPGYRGNIMVCLEIEDDRHNLTVIGGKMQFSVRFDERQQAVEYISSIRSRDAILATVHSPEVREEHVCFIRALSPAYWCLPSKRYEVWMSTSGYQETCHFAYPWATYKRMGGFTLGTGHPVPDRDEDGAGVLDYVEKFCVYLSMVSNAPVADSCVDCMACKSAAELLGSDKRRSVTKGDSRLVSKEIELGITDRISEFLSAGLI